MGTDERGLWPWQQAVDCDREGTAAAAAAAAPGVHFAGALCPAVRRLDRLLYAPDAEPLSERVARGIKRQSCACNQASGADARSVARRCDGVSLQHGGALQHACQALHYHGQSAWSCTLQVEPPVVSETQSAGRDYDPFRASCKRR